VKAFLKLKPVSPAAFSAHDLFTVMRSDDLVGRTERLADTFVSRVEALRHDVEANHEFRSILQRFPRTAPIQRGTRFILRELLRALLVDKGTKITRNHALDFFHAVVPVAYCELVLLDKYWETLAGRARSRIEGGGVPIPIASVFSRSKNGLDLFLRALEREP
jgi:hypothetical protein